MDTLSWLRRLIACHIGQRNWLVNLLRLYHLLLLLILQILRRLEHVLMEAVAAERGCPLHLLLGLAQCGIAIDTQNHGAIPDHLLLLLHILWLIPLLRGFKQE